MNFKPGYRIATADERIKLNERGLCHVVRDTGDRAMPCPNLRLPDSFACEHHAYMDKDLEPERKMPPKPDIIQAVDIRNMIKPLPGDGEEKLAKLWDDAYKAEYKEQREAYAAAMQSMQEAETRASTVTEIPYRGNGGR